MDLSSGTTTGQEASWIPDSVQNRSFTCTFCKKGFSNAQALGGHMNVHRRFRAKLKEFSQDNLLSLDINSRTITDPEDESGSPARALSPDAQVDSVVSHEKADPDGPTIQTGLPLLAEAPSSGITGDRRRAAAAAAETVDKRERSEGIRGGGDDDVDLELRLGPEPQDSKANKR